MDNPVDIVYVTALYNIQSNTGINDLVSNFLPFITAKMPIVLFTDIKTLSINDVNIVYLPKNELKVFSQNDDIELPEFRDKTKDTKDFIQLMNAKPEFLFRAKYQKTAKMYVWFDCGIMKIINDKNKFIENMKGIGSSFIESKIVIPGCVSANSVNFNNMFAVPIWRFCGGIVIVPSALVNTFNDLHNSELEKCALLKKLTWEVNLWASIEKSNPNLFHWYQADHNDSIIPNVVKTTVNTSISNVKIIFLTMIKNENVVIKRCIESGLSVCDAICICDTGSTDNTIEILDEYLKGISIPSKIYKHTWKNFGYNRSESFNSCRDFCKDLGWDPKTTYGVLLDADMQLKIGPNFNKNIFIKNGYSMMQKSPGLEYYNTRFVRFDYPWKCVGVTHEYWDGSDVGSVTPDIAYIEDIGDGGCKSDKFERDIRLLEDGLKSEPSNVRYMFYLAQSYKDSGLIDKAIQLYTLRVNSGGWYEEVWYSMFTLMKLYADKRDYSTMEMWGQKAYEYRKERSENLLFLVKHFRDRREYFKAWHYWLIGSVISKPNDILFLEPETYENAFEYERLIIHHYIFPEKKYLTMDYAIQYTNKYNNEWSYSLIKWFVEKIPSKNYNLTFHDIGDFTATSSSFCKLANGSYCVNLRYVNYRILPDGNYIMYKNGVPNYNNDVLTDNYQCIMDNNFNIVTPLQKMNMLDKPLNNSQIKGLEDVRLFMNNGEIYYTATTMEYSYNGKIRQHMGKYNINTHTFDNNISLHPPTDTYCEKNWIPYKDNKIIYKWHPFEIGYIDSNKLVIEKVQETPFFFTNMRGSTPFVKDGDFLYGITHCVIYEKPRLYYHMVVKIDIATDKIVAYTNPFYFMKNAIEYCIGLEKRNNSYYVFVSQNDKDLIFLEFNESSLVWKNL